MTWERQLQLAEACRSAFNQGRLVEAERFAWECIELDESRVPPQVLMVLAGVKCNSRRWEEVIAMLEPLRSMPQFNSTMELHKMLAMAFNATKNRDKAIETAAHGIALDGREVHLHAILWTNRVERGDPIGLDDIAHLFPLLRTEPAPSGTILFQLCAMVLSTAGRFDEACALYLPYFEREIRKAADRKPWYNWSQVEKVTSIALQSQRFGESEDELSLEAGHILRSLELGPDDRVLDVGGAGGLFAAKMASRCSVLVLTDVSSGLVERARSNLQGIANVECLCHDITGSALDRRFEKVLVAGVTPVLPNYRALEAALRNLRTMVVAGGRCLISNNYDMETASAAAIFQLRPENVLKAWNPLFIRENLLWLDVRQVRELAGELGFRDAQVINERKLADERGMFDLLLIG